MNQNTPNNNEREYLERIPFVTELLKRIDSISQFIDHGYSGVDQAINLVTDLPDTWRNEIDNDLVAIQNKYDTIMVKLDKENTRGLHPSQHDYIAGLQLMAGKDYSRAIKQRVISLLDSKGLLFLSKRQVPQSEFVDMHDLDGKKEDN